MSGTTGTTQGHDLGKGIGFGLAAAGISLAVTVGVWLTKNTDCLYALFVIFLVAWCMFGDHEQR